jgi:hypothetical protein
VVLKVLNLNSRSSPAPLWQRRHRCWSIRDVASRARVSGSEFLEGRRSEGDTMLMAVVRKRLDADGVVIRRGTTVVCLNSSAVLVHRSILMESMLTAWRHCVGLAR